jgi:hypothetical protein
MIKQLLVSIGIVICVTAPALADDQPYANQQLTPGDIFPGVTAVDICQGGYAKAHRTKYFSKRFRQTLYATYNDQYIPRSGDYELDHKVSLENGGTNSNANLWPESYRILWGARVKDRLENKIHEQICNQIITIQQGQQMLEGDWIAAYKYYFGPVPSTKRYFPKYTANTLYRSAYTTDSPDKDNE